MKLGPILKSRRLHLHMKLADVARQTGINYPYLADVESGRIEPTTKALLAVCRILNIDPSVLIDTTWYMKVDNSEDWTKVRAAPAHIDAYWAALRTHQMPPPTTLIEQFEDHFIVWKLPQEGER